MWVEIEFTRGGGKRFQPGAWYPVLEGDDGRTLTLKCIDVHGDIVTFEMPKVAEA